MRLNLQETDSPCYNCEATEKGEDYTIVAIIFGVIGAGLLTFVVCKLVIYLLKGRKGDGNTRQSATPREVTNAV